MKSPKKAPPVPAVTPAAVKARAKWQYLCELINDYVEASIQDSWKGGGDPEDMDWKEVQKNLAFEKLRAHIAKMEREENS